MKLSPHQAMGVDLPARLLTGLRQRLNKPPPILIIGKNGFPAAAAIYHVVIDAGVLNPYLRAMTKPDPDRSRDVKQI
jgi:hypothetical protein